LVTNVQNEKQKMMIVVYKEHKCEYHFLLFSKQTHKYTTHEDS